MNFSKEFCDRRFVEWQSAFVRQFGSRLLVSRGLQVAFAYVYQRGSNGFPHCRKIIERLTDSQNSNYFRQGMDKIRAALRAVDKKHLHDMDDSIAVYKSKNAGESLPNLMQVILSSINDIIKQIISRG